MDTIYKYTLNVDTSEEQTLLVPLGASLLSVQEQGGQIALWFMVNTDMKRQDECTFRVIWTGTDITEILKDFMYIQTVKVGSHMVYHVFEKV